MADPIHMTGPNSLDTGGPTDDCIQPYMIDKTGLHGRMVKLGPSVDAILSRHGYPHAVLQEVTTDEAATDRGEGRAA